MKRSYPVPRMRLDKTAAELLEAVHTTKMWFYENPVDIYRLKSADA